MNDYELMYILHPRLTADETEAAVERISGFITGAGGEIVSVDRWGRRRLAYPIDRNLEGYYVLTTYNSAPSLGPALEAQLNLAEDVLRHLLIRGIIPYEGPPREERSADRGVRESAPSSSDSAGADAGEAPDEDAEPATAEAAAAPEPVAETAPPEQPEAAAPAPEAGEEEEQAAPPAAE